MVEDRTGDFWNQNYYEARFREQRSKQRLQNNQTGVEGDLKAYRRWKSLKTNNICMIHWRIAGKETLNLLDAKNHVKYLKVTSSRCPESNRNSTTIDNASLR